MGAGASESYSFSESLKDFVVDNDSKGNQVHHLYKMAQSSGGAYDHKKPWELVRGLGSTLSVSQAMQGAEVFDPPDLARHDFPIISQAVWQKDDADMITSNCHLRIEVHQCTHMVEGTNNFPRMDAKWDLKRKIYKHDVVVDFLALKSQFGTTL